MRPIKSNAWDAPNPGQEASELCFNQAFDERKGLPYGTCEISSKFHLPCDQSHNFVHIFTVNI